LPLAACAQDLLQDAALLITKDIAPQALDNDSPWNIISRLGKQQPVFIAEYATAEGSIPLVIRPTQRQFRQHYTQYETVRRHFPKLYAGIEVPYYNQYARDILIMEKLEGEHGDSRSESERNAYLQRVGMPEGFELLCADMFKTLDEILALPLALEDTRPATGHNVFYDTRTGHFRLFDVDTLNESSDPHMEKFLHIINPQQILRSGVETAFTLRMLRAYQDKYGVADFAHHNHKVTHQCSYSIANTPSETGTERLVQYGDPDYDGAMIGVFGWHKYLELIGTHADTLPVLRRHIIYGTATVALHPAVLEAVSLNSSERLRTALEETNGHLTAQTFHPAAAA